MRSQLRTGAKTEECLSRRHGDTGEEGKGKGGRKEVVGCQLKTCPMFVPKDYSQGEIALNLSYGLGLHHQLTTVN
jgi:hypothetical protein